MCRRTTIALFILTAVTLAVPPPRAEDGLQILFSRQLNRQDDLYVIGLDGGESRRLTDHRAKDSHGVIPGAILLTSSSGFAPSELPTDKATKLVFYCSNEFCGAAPSAARKAAAEGYSDIHVLTAGIKGWVEGSQPVDRPEAS